jgi:cell division protein FtsI/penicillin-binding protein 2
VRLRSKSLRRRASAGAALAVAVAAVFFHSGGTSPEQTVANFLLYWEQGDYHQAAALTTGQPKAVANELAGAYAQLDATDLVLGMGHISQQGGSATAVFNATIDLGNSGLQWRYPGWFALRETGSTWKVVWSPSVIVPGLRAGDRLAVFEDVPERALVDAASGQSLTLPSLAYEIGVVPGQLRGSEITRTANDLAAVLGLPAAQVAGQIEAALQRSFQELVTLEPGQYAQVAARIKQIPGLHVRTVYQRLDDSIAPDVVGTVGTETAPQLIHNGDQYRPGNTVGQTGLQETYQSRLVGTPGTYVLIERQGHADFVLRDWAATKGTPVRTTLDYGMQVAAGNAAFQAGGSAAIVAVDASDGKVLAAASHQAAGMPALQPLAGQYEPGQAFTIISAAAFLASGVSPDNVLPCVPKNEVGAETFVNLPGGGNTRELSFSKDFAAGCSTAFAGLSQKLSAGQLATAAGEFGIGARWQLPLPASSYFAGSIGTPSGQAGLAADTVGWGGGVLVSPLSMALAAAVADTGHLSEPSLVTGEPDPKTAVKAAMTAQQLTELQGLMHQAVEHGAASGARVAGDVYGQAGIAPFGTNSKTYISWFVGYQGDTAFAVVELVKSPDDAAAALAGSFLRNIQAAS